MANDHLSTDLHAALRGDRGPVVIAVAAGPAFDRVGVVAAAGIDANEIASALANIPVPATGGTVDDIWDRLAIGMRRASELKSRSRLIACAISWRGRGRIVGPLNPDLLIRFGVSSWR